MPSTAAFKKIFKSANKIRTFEINIKISAFRILYLYLNQVDITHYLV
jgi:hypothetical protein